MKIVQVSSGGACADKSLLMSGLNEDLYKADLLWVSCTQLCKSAACIC